MRPKSFMENEEILYGNLIFLFSVSSMSNKTNLFNYIYFKLNRSVNKLKVTFHWKFRFLQVLWYKGYPLRTKLVNQQVISCYWQRPIQSYKSRKNFYSNQNFKKMSRHAMKLYCYFVTLVSFTPCSHKLNRIKWIYTKFLWVRKIKYNIQFYQNLSS